jgi:thiamine-monophosphate kinase
MARRPRLHEFRLIEQLRRAFGRTGASVVRGIGDDAAVVTPPKGRQLVLTTDLLVERVHFDLRTASFEEIGYKAAIANLSDIAAMGARPEYALVAIALPASCAAPQILRLYKGILAACRPCEVALIGGDTSASPDKLFLSLTVTGSVPAGRALMRSGARAGDLLYVTGTLGDSLAGLALLSRGNRRAATASLKSSERNFLIERHRRPIAHPGLGQLLSTHRLASAAIDLSDGLSGDLRHLCEQSRVGAEITAAALPLSPALRAYARTSRTDPVALALQGGEDYELLFTVPPARQPALHRLARRAGRRLTCIGRIRPKSFGVMVRETTGRLRRLPVTSYVHFQGAAPQ